VASECATGVGQHAERRCGDTAGFSCLLCSLFPSAPNYQSGTANPFEDLVDDDSLYAQLQKEGEKKGGVSFGAHVMLGAQ
jgi:hypothetical protein